MDKLIKKLASKAKHKEMSPAELEAKKAVLHHLMSDMDEMMAGKMNGLKKVTVASNSEEGLEHGLDKAKDVLHKMPKHEESAEDIDPEDEEKSEGAFPDDHEHVDADEDAEHNQEEAELDNHEHELQSHEKSDDEDMEEKLKKLKSLRESK